jgi:hypothetical protein
MNHGIRVAAGLAASILAAPLASAQAKPAWW